MAMDNQDASPIERIIDEAFKQAPEMGVITDYRIAPEPACISQITMYQRQDRDNERHQRIRSRQDERYREIGELRFNDEDEDE